MKFNPVQDQKNANRGSDRGKAALKESLLKLKAGRGILLDKNGVAIAGNKTLQIAQDLGIEILPIESDGTKLIATVRTDLDLTKDAFARELAFADNRIAELDLDWDLDEIQEAFDDGLELSWLWNEDELDALLADNSDNLYDAESDEEDTADALDAADAGELESRVKTGEIWQLGRHFIACCDSTVESNIRQVLEISKTRSPSFVFCDPPYGVNIVTSERLGNSKPFGPHKDLRGTIGASKVVKVNKYAPIIGDDSIDTAINAYQVAAAISPVGVHIWWGGNYYASQLPNSSCWIVWDKENTGDFADAELAWTNSPTTTRIFKHMWNGMLKASEHGQRRIHPTQKPIALAQYCFENYGKVNDVILDQFLGSGVSLIAAQQMEGDRTVIGFELSEAYCEVICQRFEKLTGIEAHKVGSVEIGL